MSWLERLELNHLKQLRKPIMFDFSKVSDETINRLNNIPTQAPKDFDFTKEELHCDWERQLADGVKRIYSDLYGENRSVSDLINNQIE